MILCCKGSGHLVSAPEGQARAHVLVALPLGSYSPCQKWFYNVQTGMEMQE